MSRQSAGSMSDVEDGIINLITYALDDTATALEVQRYLDLQVLNSIRCGWRPERIQIRTNFGYHCPVHPVSTLDVNAPRKTTFAKWIGIRDALLSGARKIWSHDHDGWQLNPFPAMAVDKVRMRQWSSLGASPLLCSASFFLTADALPFVLAFIAFEEQRRTDNYIRDEYLLAGFLSEHPEFLRHLAMDLPIQYCYNHYGDAHRADVAELRLEYLHHKLPIVLRNFPRSLPDGFKELLAAEGYGG